MSSKRPYTRAPAVGAAAGLIGTGEAPPPPRSGGARRLTFRLAEHRLELGAGVLSLLVSGGVARLLAG